MRYDRILNVRVSAVDYDWLKKYSKTTGMGLSEIGRMAIVLLIKKEDQKKNRAKLNGDRHGNK